MQKLLKEIKEQEKLLKLYEIRIIGVPLWRLLRFPIRVNKLKKEVGFTNSTIQHKVNWLELFLEFFISSLQFLRLIIRRKKFDNIVFAFPRLVKYEDVYFDKFTDPIIAQTDLKNNVLVVQRSLSGNHLKPRLQDHSNLIISDFIDLFSKLLGIVLFPLFYLLYYKKINMLYNNANKYFDLTNKFKIHASIKIAEFLIQYKFWKSIIKKTGAKSIILVNRSIFFPQIVAGKHLRISSYELQHGITHSETPLYTGSYQPKIDPDFFLTFSKRWMREQFAMPLNKVFNIGWAYKTWVSGRLNVKEEKNTVLVVSSPEITNKILQVVTELSEIYKNYIFVLRLHPQEKLSPIQVQEVNKIDNLRIDNKGVDSIVSVMTYEYCIGENSSVLYEALNYGKPTAKIMYNGLGKKGSTDNDDASLYYLYASGDFNNFLNKEWLNIDEKYQRSYDDFDSSVFETILNKTI